jgi:YHS domain-containing protein
VIRLILYLLTSVLLISALRSVIGWIARQFTNSVGLGSTRPVAPERGLEELHKDPVCGTFVASAAAVRKTVGGQVYYFCSEACRAKFQNPKSQTSA